jgi:uncharacterized protein
LSIEAASDLAARERRLHDLLAAFDSVIVAFSGGVDSAYLAWAATQVLGPAALCITADSPSYPAHHRQLAIRIAREFGLHHEFVRTAEMERPDYRANPVDRCYHCKHELYTVLTELADARGITAIVDGSNADDRSDYRPGRRAAREFGVRSPLDDADLSKADIRELSRAASEKLQIIERAETVLRDLGFRVCRVRHHDGLARLEFGRDEMERAFEPGVREQIVRELRALGYQHVAIDLQGYRMGSLNEGVRLRPA